LGIIEEISRANQFGDFNAITDDRVKFEVYRLTLEDMFTTFGKDRNKLSNELLGKVKEGLEMMENGFYKLINEAAIQEFDLTKVMPIFNDARGLLDSAVWILETEGKKAPGYSTNLGGCRFKINELIQQLERVPRPVKSNENVTGGTSVGTVSSNETVPERTGT